MNSLEDERITGTAGELLVQLRLFQYDVQAAPPLKDSGNDLIAIRGEDFQAVQVKTTGQDTGRWKIPDGKDYHLLALVRLEGEGDHYYLDESGVHLIDREKAESESFSIRGNLSEYKISRDVVDSFFPSSGSSAPPAVEA